MKSPKQYFRAGAGAVITDAGGHVLVFERHDIPGAWQFPQGGMNDGESPMEAVLRELREETGLSRTSVRLLSRYPELLTYELPPRARSPKTGLGQVQYWFFFRLVRARTITRFTATSEFTAFEWVTFPEAVARVVSFKKPVYRRLQKYFETMPQTPARGQRRNLRTVHR